MLLLCNINYFHAFALRTKRLAQVSGLPKKKEGRDLPTAIKPEKN